MMKPPVGTLLTDPLPKLATGLFTGDPDQGEREKVLLTQTRPIQVDHLRPGPRVDILLSIRVNLVNRLVDVPHDHGLHSRLRIQDRPCLLFEIKKKRGFLLQNLGRRFEAGVPLPAIGEPGFQKVEGRKKNIPDREPGIEEKAEENENFDRPDFVEKFPFPFETVDDLQDVNASPREIQKGFVEVWLQKRLLEIEHMNGLELISMPDLNAPLDANPIPIGDNLDFVAWKLRFGVPFPNDPLTDLGKEQIGVVITDHVSDSLVGLSGETLQGRHDLRVSGNDGLELVQRNLLRNRVLEFSEIRHIQKIKKITVQEEFDVDGALGTLVIKTRREIIEKINHFVIELEVFMRIKPAFEKLARR